MHSLGHKADFWDHCTSPKPLGWGSCRNRALSQAPGHLRAVPSLCQCSRRGGWGDTHGAGPPTRPSGGSGACRPSVSPCTSPCWHQTRAGPWSRSSRRRSRFCWQSSTPPAVTVRVSTAPPHPGTAQEPPPGLQGVPSLWNDPFKTGCATWFGWQGAVGS